MFVYPKTLRNPRFLSSPFTSHSRFSFHYFPTQSPLFFSNFSSLFLFFFPLIFFQPNNTIMFLKNWKSKKRPLCCKISNIYRKLQWLGLIPSNGLSPFKNQRRKHVLAQNHFRPFKISKKNCNFELVMQSISQWLILESQGSSLGIVFNVYVFRESQRDHYRKARINHSLARIDPWGNILLIFF